MNDSPVVKLLKVKVSRFPSRSYSLYAILAHVLSNSVRQLTLGLKKLPLWWRYSVRSGFARAKSASASASTLILDFPIQKVRAVVINLDTRPDRWSGVSHHLKKFGINAHRFSARTHAQALAGCAMSHSAVLSAAAETWPIPLMVLEDDVRFIGTLEEIDCVLRDFLRDPALDVLCLAQRSSPPRVQAGENLLVAKNILTTAAYVAKPRAAKLLQATFLESASHIASGRPPEKFALDILWQKLQKSTLLFAIPRRPIAIQATSYSDIQKAFVDYSYFYEKSFVKPEKNIPRLEPR